MHYFYGLIFQGWVDEPADHSGNLAYLMPNSHSQPLSGADLRGGCSELGGALVQPLKQQHMGY